MKHRSRGNRGQIRCRCLLAASLFIQSECASPTSIISAFALGRQRGGSTNNKCIVFYNSYYETYIRNIQRSPRDHHRHTLRRTIQRLSSSSDFPSQEYYHKDLSEDDDDINNDIQFQRRNYDQSKIGSIPTDRLALMRSTGSTNSNEEDDEWDSYLDMNVDSEGNYVQNNDSNEINYNDRDDVHENTISARVEQTQANDVQQLDYESSTFDAGPSLGNGGYDSRKVHVHKDKEKDSTKMINEQQPRVNEFTRVDESVDGFRNQFGIQSKSSIDNVKDESRSRDTQSKKQRITTEQIQQIKSSISLVDAIETYNLPEFTRTSSSLYTSSAAAKACCPFHNDNNPSMSIDDARGLYKCFACGAGGDIFNFIREYDYLDKGRSGGKEKMGYMAAVEYAVREFGNGEYDSDNWNFGGSKGEGRFEGMSDETRERIRAREKKKDR